MPHAEANPWMDRQQTFRKSWINCFRRPPGLRWPWDSANGTVVGVPHYSVIEARAHELGRQLSRSETGHAYGRNDLPCDGLGEMSRVWDTR